MEKVYKYLDEQGVDASFIKDMDTGMLLVTGVAASCAVYSILKLCASGEEDASSFKASPIKKVKEVKERAKVVEPVVSSKVEELPADESTEAKKTKKKKKKTSKVNLFRVISLVSSLLSHTPRGSRHICI